MLFIRKITLFILLSLFGTPALASVPWFVIYQDASKLNDVQIWKENVDDLMKQYKWNIDDRSYQSEAGSIARSLGEINRPEIVDILWQYYKSGGDYRDAALTACLDMSRANELMQSKFLNEFSTMSDDSLKFKIARRMLDWERVPELAVTFYFNTFNDKPQKDHLSYLSSLSSKLVNLKAPPQHLELLQNRVFERLMIADSTEEVKILTGILAQLERWTASAYIIATKIYQQGKISKRTYMTLLTTASREVNGTVGATFENLAPISIDAFFGMLILAKDDESSEVRAAAVEASLWQSQKREFPSQLRNWIANEVFNDKPVYQRAMEFYWSWDPPTQRQLHKVFPNAFPAPTTNIFRTVRNGCAAILTSLRDRLPF